METFKLYFAVKMLHIITNLPLLRTTYSSSQQHSIMFSCVHFVLMSCVHPCILTASCPNMSHLNRSLPDMCAYLDPHVPGEVIAQLSSHLTV